MKNTQVSKQEKTQGLQSIIKCAAGLAVCAVIVVALLLLLPNGSAPKPPIRRGNYKVTVLLNVDADCGFEVISENPVRIDAGEDASFQIKIHEGFKLSENQSSDFEYDAETGTVTLRKVKYPTETRILARPLQKLTLDVSNDKRNGDFSVLVGGSDTIPEVIDEDTVIKITATQKKGKTFIGFSVGAPISGGGTVVSYSSEYEFAITENTKLYTNYATEGAQIIVYDTNGGHVSGSNNTTIYIENLDKNYICPNTLPDKGYMEREGFVLVSYNTAPDGSGESYGLGWNVPIPDSGMLKLYAQWMEQSPNSDFEYKVANGKVTITKYKGNDAVVVIPEKIDGKAVAAISSNAFVGKALETLVLSRNLRTVSANAFMKCSSLKNLYISDMITSMSDESFKYCNALSTLYVNAVTDPRYTKSRNGTYQIKFERLMTVKSPMLVIVSGSSSAYGIDSARLEKGINGQYNVVNYGTNQDTPAIFYMEFISKFIKEGDILIHAPEPRNYQWGYNEINTTTWQIFEAAYNAFSYVDIRNYTKVFSSFAEFNNSRIGMTPRKYEDYTHETVNKYGDYIKYKTNQKDNYGSGENRDLFNLKYFTDSNIENLNRAYKMIESAGGRVYISFAPICKNALHANSKLSKTQSAYMQKVKDSFGRAVISNPGDYVMEGKYFHNSIFHLSTEGSHIRTDKLAKDILAQLAKEKK